MTIRVKVTARWLGGGVLAMALIGAVAMRVMPPPHRPLEYMIAGTAATGIALAIAFAAMQMGRG